MKHLISKKFHCDRIIYSIFLPALLLAKPQVEEQIKKECINLFIGQNVSLQQAVSQPCGAIASPIADCLIREADKSNKVLSIISEILSKKFGEGSEAVAKACIAKTLKIPVESLKELPLNILANNQQPKPGYKSNCETKNQSDLNHKKPIEAGL